MSDEKMTEAINGLNKEIRDLRVRLTSATYRAEGLANRALEAEARLEESRRQVGVLVDSRRHIDAVVTIHGVALRQALEALRGRDELSAEEQALLEMLGVICG